METLKEIDKVNQQLPLDDSALIVKRKKGRPRKDVDKDLTLDKAPEEKKKRGRKKKENVVEEVKQKKKRGRKAAVKYFSSSIRKKIPLTTVLQDNNNFILHLDIKDDDQLEENTELDYDGIEDTDINIGIVNQEDKESTYSGQEGVLDDNRESVINLVFSNLENENQEIVNELQKEYDDLLEERDSILGDIEDEDALENLSELYAKRVKFREQQDNMLVNKLETKDKTRVFVENETKNIDDKISIIQDNNKKRGYFEIMCKFIHNKNWLHSSDVSCWWCCHQFETIPIGLPDDYNYNNEKFRVKGIFCSFSCMLAYKDDKRIKNKDYLIKALYCKLTGTVLVDAKLKAAPPRCSLKMFGGELTIEEFRNSCNENKVYKMIDYPMFVSKDFIEEVDIQNVKAVNKTAFQDKIVYNLDDKRVEDAKIRLSHIEQATVTVGNTIDKFIKFS